MDRTEFFPACCFNMNEFRTIEFLLNAPAPHMVGDGFRVHHYFPGGAVFGMDRLSPFFMLDYNAEIKFPPSPKPRGVDVHPHRGFETVSIVFKGRIAHQDSAGNKGIIGEGDVQWMTAASGVLHKEFHEEEYSKSGGAFHMAQIWVNLPAKNKMDPPKYQEISREQIPHLAFPNADLALIAGTYQNIQGPAKTHSPLLLGVLHLYPNASITLDIPDTYNCCMLAMKASSLRIGQEFVSENQLAILANNGNKIVLECESEAKLLLLAGEPLNEPIAAYGPFVMNTQEEIRQALDDYRSGRFGQL